MQKFFPLFKHVNRVSVIDCESKLRIISHVDAVHYQKLLCVIQNFGIKADPIQVESIKRKVMIYQFKCEPRNSIAD